MKFDRGGEYYGRNDGSGKQPKRPIAKFLEEYRIVPHYITPGKPSMKSAAERRNIMFKDMVRSVSNHSSLPESLWGKIFKTAVYFLNGVRIKAVVKIGCPTDV